MPDGEGKVYWSAGAGQFYQEGRSGALSRLEGLSHLTAVETPSGIRYQDELGHFVPSLPDLIPSSMDFQFIDRLAEGKPIGEEVYLDKPDFGVGYGTLFTYQDLEGNVNVGFKFNRIGATIDSEVERAKIIAQIGADLGIDESDPEGGSDNIEKLISGIFHFSIS